MANFPMTKKQYLLFKEKAEKGFELVSRQECEMADELIKGSTLSNLESILLKAMYPPLITKFILTWSEFHFGDSEIDNFLIEIEAYPEWI